MFAAAQMARTHSIPSTACGLYNIPRKNQQAARKFDGLYPECVTQISFAAVRQHLALAPPNGSLVVMQSPIQRSSVQELFAPGGFQSDNSFCLTGSSPDGKRETEACLRDSECK